MTRVWLTPEEAAARLPVSVNTVRRWVDRYIAGEIAAGRRAGPSSPPPPDGAAGLIKGWLLPERRGGGESRAVDAVDVDRIRAWYGLPAHPPSAGDDPPEPGHGA